MYYVSHSFFLSSMKRTVCTWSSVFFFGIYMTRHIKHNKTRNEIKIFKSVIECALHTNTHNRQYNTMHCYVNAVNMRAPIWMIQQYRSIVYHGYRLLVCSLFFWFMTHDYNKANENIKEILLLNFDERRRFQSRMRNWNWNGSLLHCGNIIEKLAPNESHFRPLILHRN